MDLVIVKSMYRNKVQQVNSVLVNILHMKMIFILLLILLKRAHFLIDYVLFFFNERYIV